MPDFHTRKDCRACGSTELTSILNLGEMPPANAFLPLEDFGKEKSYPLELFHCAYCGLAQLTTVVHPDILFKNYHYATSASTPMKEHFRRYAETIKPLVNDRELVIDVGGNDGLLLSYVKDFAQVVCIDPAANLAHTCNENGVRFMEAQFNLESAYFASNFYGKAKVITANNVLAHTDDPQGMLAGVVDLLTDDGTFICEVQWAKALIDDVSYDHIYHEHVSYFSLQSLTSLMEKSGLYVYDAQVVHTQGPSLRVFASRHKKERSNAIIYIVAQEREAYLNKTETYTRFGKRAAQHAMTLKEVLGDLKHAGAQIVGYGAPAKSSTMLNFAGVGRQTLDYIVDTTPIKQGLYGPGHHVSITSPADLHEDEPDYAVLFAWNYRNEILAKEQHLRKKGTKFIVPIPSIEIV